MLKRIAIVVLAYLAACCIAGLVLNGELFVWKVLIDGDRSLDIKTAAEAVGAMLVFSLIVGAYVAIFALLPVVVALPLMLRLGWTSRVWTAVAGAAVGLVHPIYDVLRWQIFGGGPTDWIAGTLGFGTGLAIAGACAALAFRAMARTSLGLQ